MRGDETENESEDVGDKRRRLLERITADMDNGDAKAKMEAVRVAGNALNNAEQRVAELSRLPPVRPKFVSEGETSKTVLGKLFRLSYEDAWGQENGVSDIAKTRLSAFWKSRAKPFDVKCCGHDDMAAAEAMGKASAGDGDAVMGLLDIYDQLLNVENAIAALKKAEDDVVAKKAEYVGAQVVYYECSMVVCSNQESASL